MKLNQAYNYLPAAIGFLLLATIATENADAQMFGNGRFLRRVHNDLFGAPAKPKPTPKAKKAKAPTPAARPSNQPTPAKQANARSGQNVVTQPPPSPRLATAANLPAPQPTGLNSASRLKKEPVRSNAAGTLGFGMLVQLRNRQLFVSQINPNGNAAKAGIRVGDHLIAGGGIDFESLSDFNGIADVLRDGDQLEFKVARASRTKKVLLLFGDAKDMADIEQDISYENAPIDDSLDADDGGQINNINTRENNSFMPTQRNTRQAQSSTTSNRSISQNPRQLTHPHSSNQSIGSQQSNYQLQIPSKAKSVLDFD